MELLTLEDFSGCVNEPFATRLDDVNLEFVLVEARPIGAAAPHPMRKPFSSRLAARARAFSTMR